MRELWYLLIAENIHLSSAVDEIDTFEVPRHTYIPKSAQIAFGATLSSGHLLSEEMDEVTRPVGTLRRLSTKIKYF